MVERLVAAVVGGACLVAIVLATQMKLEQCPDGDSWGFRPFTDRVGCEQHAWWRVVAGDLGVLSDVH